MGFVNKIIDIDEQFWWSSGGEIQWSKFRENGIKQVLKKV